MVSRREKDCGVQGPSLLAQFGIARSEMRWLPSASVSESPGREENIASEYGRRTARATRACEPRRGRYLVDFADCPPKQKGHRYMPISTSNLGTPKSVHIVLRMGVRATNRDVYAQYF